MPSRHWVSSFNATCEAALIRARSPDQADRVRQRHSCSSRLRHGLGAGCAACLAIIP
ncbi:MAG: hypothetical protein WCJ69_11220 [Betaproteobacteria bacterium]